MDHDIDRCRQLRQRAWAAIHESASDATMRVLAWASAALRRLPRSSELLADFSRLVESDGGRPNIEHGLEAVLQRSLKRTVAVITVDTLPKDEKGTSRDDGAWHMDRRTIATWLESGRLGATGASKLAELFGGTAGAPARIAALVPVTSSAGSRLATVVVGKRRFLPLADTERSLIAAAVGMATLLLEQTRLRNAISVAAEAETVRHIVANHARQAKRHFDIDERNLN